MSQCVSSVDLVKAQKILDERISKIQRCNTCGRALNPAADTQMKKHFICIDCVNRLEQIIILR